MAHIRYLITLYCFVESFVIFSQTDKATYLERQKLEIGDSLIDITGKGYQLYLSGERHDHKNNKYSELELLKYYYYHKDVRYFIFEFSDRAAKTITEYLQSGKPELLDEMPAYTEKLQDEDRQFYISIKAFWDSLPEKEKFKIVGVDVSIYSNEILEDLSALIPKEYSSQNGILNIVYVERREKKAIKKLEKIKRAIEKDTLKYQLLLKNNYPVFMHVLKGGLIGLKEYGQTDETGMENREQFMYENIKQIVIDDPNAKMFGQFGRAHVTLSYQGHWLHLKNWKSMAARLNTNAGSPLKDKVCSVVYYYTSEFEDESRGYAEPIIAKEDIPLFLKESTASLTLFKLDADDSPFKDMAERFQYLMLIKDK